jgi:preprotein translocase subunit Sec61beta
MTPRLHKFVLTAHITFSVGWLGAAVAYLALAVAGLTSQDVSMVRAAYFSMELIGWFVIVPFSLAALLTGLVQSLGTQWGLFRHYWILVKFLLTTGATVVLLWHMQAVSRMSAVAAETALSSADFRALRIELVVHAAGGLLVLLAATTLSVYKPWGMTPYVRRKQHERRKVSQAGLLSYPDSSVGPDQGSITSAPRWVYVVGIHAIGLVLLFVVLHLTGRGLPGH